MKKLVFGIVMALLLASCSDNTQYVNAIPKRSKAVLSVDVQKLGGMDSTMLLKTMFHLNNLKEGALDLSKRMYAFESPYGYYGLCAAVSDADEVAQQLQQNHCTITEFRDCRIGVLDNSWMVGFTDDALLVMGPVTINAQRDLMRTMAKYLHQDKENGLLSSPLCAQLDSLQTPMALVSQVESLPQIMSTFLSICMPNDLPSKQLYYAAGISVARDVVQVDGYLYSYDKTINAAIKDYQSRRLNNITDKYLASMCRSDVVTIFLNTQEKLDVLLEGKNNFEKLLSVLNSSSGEDYRPLIGSAQGEMLIGVLKGNPFYYVHMLLSQYDANWRKYIGKIPKSIYWMDETLCAGMGYNVYNVGRPSLIPKEMIEGKRAAFVVNLGKLAQATSLPVFEKIDSVLGDKHRIVFTVKDGKD